MTHKQWQLLYDVWEKNQRNLVGISIQASLHKDNIPALEQFQNSLIEDYKADPEKVKAELGVDLKPYLS